MTDTKMNHETKKISVYKEIYKKNISYLKNRKPLNWPLATLLKMIIFFIGFAFPLIGMLIWVLIREHHPEYSKYVGLGTFLGYYFNIFMNVVPRFHGLPLW